ncbi:MAG: hypothetical protein WDN75_15990 [Bacteroidota bacterium]
MEPFKQRILELTLVAVIKGVAITGLMAEVVVFYASKHAERIKSAVKKRIGSLRIGTANQLIKN